MRKIIWKLREGFEKEYDEYIKKLKDNGEVIVSEEKGQDRHGDIVIITIK